MENTLTYHLENSKTGELIDGISYSSLDTARDIALSVVEEEKIDVVIKQNFGFSSCIWEEYDYATYG